jgi:hypothetical protein
MKENSCPYQDSNSDPSEWIFNKIKLKLLQLHESDVQSIWNAVVGASGIS